MDNPFYQNPTEPIPFDTFTVENIQTATTQLIEHVNNCKARIIAADAGDVEGRLLARDAMFDDLDFVLSPIYLLKETHPDADVRAACQESVETLFNFYNELCLDEDLYRSLQEFCDGRPNLDPLLQRYAQKSLERYLRDGFQLDAEARAQLKELDDQISQKSLLFQKHIAESVPTLYYSQADLEGMPEDWMAAHRQEDGRYAVTTQYPDYFPIMKYAANARVRKDLYTAYLTRAQDKNIDLLNEILALRVQRIKLLGFETYAKYNLELVMAKHPDTVWEFLNELAEKVAEKANRDYREMAEAAGVETLESWDKFYIATRLKETRYQLDEEEVKQYFPLNRVIDGLFMTAQTLYSLEFKENKSLSRWHEDVLAYEVFDGGSLVGRFYLDLHPRPNKYGHAACFGLRNGRRIGDAYQPPHAALVCNFSPPSGDKPSLLGHDEVETFFHEFGHLMHQLLTTSPLSAFSGTSVARDFVEMPSQIMESWVWEKEALKKFAAHYETGEIIPDALIDRMLAVKHLNSGMDIQQQVFYATLDMTYHDGFTPGEPAETTAVAYRLQDEHTLFPALEGTCIHASFGHLIGYAAAYYGYLWSRVFADDMYSVFKAEGIFNPKTGKRFREIVLATGDCREPMDLIQEFLGREPDMDAFLANIGL